MMRCVRFQRDKKHWNAREENMTANENNKNNDISSEKYGESAVSNHATPVSNRQGTNNAEESLEPDLYSSPVLPPCTQEGGNEVAWDWQNSLSKTPESRNKKRNLHCETPKGTKLLQKKRNSDSPLLYKPIKRKTINMENREHFGQFAAELQALTEKMSVIKHNDQNYLDNQVEKEEVPILADTNFEEEVPAIEDKQNCIGEINDHEENDTIIKKEAKYDDLFDDSIDDDMIRCTQEIEEKLKSVADKGNSTHSESSIKKDELYEKPDATKNAFDKYAVQSTSNDNFKELSAENLFHNDTYKNNTLKTYSKLANRNSNSSIHITEWTDKNNLYKLCESNSNMIHSSIRSTCDNKKLLSKTKATKSFDFPDDSFDDCLAACIDDDKSWRFDSLVCRNQSTKFEASFERLARAPLKMEAHSLKGNPQFPSTKGEVSNASSTDKKFFKTKSLSDHYLNQNKSNATRSTLALNSTAKSSTITCRNVTRGSVSTNPIVTATGDRKVAENHTISLMRGADQTRPNGSDDVNRCTIKGGDGDRFVRHHSTGNMNNDAKQVSKTGSQPTRCTPEEIERKRQQALMKLEAKRKLYAGMKITNNVNR